MNFGKMEGCIAYIEVLEFQLGKTVIKSWSDFFGTMLTVNC